MTDFVLHLRDSNLWKNLFYHKSGQYIQ